MKSVLGYLFAVIWLAVMMNGGEACAQNKKIDSLLTLLGNDQEDTVKIAHLNDLSWEYKSLGSYDTALSYCSNALRLSQKINFEKGTAAAFAGMGNVYALRGDYPKALEYYLSALEIDEKLGNKIGIARRLGNIGLVYSDQGENSKALGYYLKALKITEELRDKNGMAKHLGNIGTVYYEQKDYVKALDYYFRALKMAEEIGYDKGIATDMGNIGLVYADQAKESDFNSAQREALFGKALDYYFKTLELRTVSGNKLEMANTLANIGSLYTEQKKYNDAYTYLYRALAISDSIGATDDVKSWYEELSNLYEKSNIPLRDSIGGKFLNGNQMYQRALYYYKRYISVKDSLFSEESKKQLVRKEMNYEFEKKEAAAKAEADKQAAVTEAEKQKQKFILVLVSCFLFLVLVFSGFIFRALRVTRRQKVIIENQKMIVEEKQKEILDSIHYARRIQTALLPTEKYMDRTLKRLLKN